MDGDIIVNEQTIAPKIPWPPCSGNQQQLPEPCCAVFTVEHGELCLLQVEAAGALPALGTAVGRQGKPHRSELWYLRTPVIRYIKFFYLLAKKGC